MAKVCPQRIIGEAVKLLMDCQTAHPEDEERVINNIIELRGLSKALYRDGIISIEENRDVGLRD